MTACDRLFIEPPPSSQHTSAHFLPVMEVSARLGVAATTVRRMIWNRDRTGVEARLLPDARGYEINIATLPAKHRPKFAQELGRPAPSTLRAAAEGEHVSRFMAVGAKPRQRAQFRYEAVISFAKAPQACERKQSADGRRT